MNVVEIGIFADAKANASLASSSSTPSISYKIFPGLIGQTQYSTFPLPLPCLTSKGFFGYWLIRKNSYPNFCSSFDMTSHCPSGSLNLPRS